MFLLSWTIDMLLTSLPDAIRLYEYQCTRIFEAFSKAAADNQHKIAVALLKDNKIAEALIAFNRALIWDQTDPKLYVKRALVHNRLRLYEMVVDDCKKAIEYDPHLEDAYKILSKSYSELHLAALDATNKCATLIASNNQWKV